MAVSCASRFAVLKLEDDDAENASSTASASIQPNCSEVESRKVNVNKNVSSPVESKKSRKKKKSLTDVAELQNLAFGIKSSKVKSKSGNNMPGISHSASIKQWEEWKKKDSKYVSEAYEQDLQEALLLSKIDYEEKKDVYDAVQKEVEETKKNDQNHKRKKKNQLKKEKNSMSIDEFQNFQPTQHSYYYNKGKADILDNFEVNEKYVSDETDFFEKIEEDAEKIISSEEAQEIYKKNECETIQTNQPSVLSLQFQEEVKKKDEEIILLKETIDKLKEELKVVKTRNKRLCGILAAGEMKEKAEILVQIENLTSVKDELTQQIHAFHTALEQERSKVHHLQTELKKYQNSKRERRDSK